MSKGLFLVCLLLSGALSYAGTLTGQIQNSAGQQVANGTLQFKLSQNGNLCGVATLVTSPVFCYTDAQGNVVGEPNPLVTPAASSNLASGTLPAATYFFRITIEDSSGQTAASPEGALVLASIGTLIITAPAKQPSSATGYCAYISSATNSETFQGCVTGTPGSWANFSQSTPLGNGASYPVSNSTVCTLHFNDEIQPAFTGYQVSLTNALGLPVPGYPQTWYLSGGPNGTMNLSSGLPQFGGIVIYPVPIIANPVQSAQQSINGPLSLNGFNLNQFGTLNQAGNASKSGTAMNVISGASFKARNHANSGDVNLMFMDTSDVLHLGDAAGVTFNFVLSLCLNSDSGFTRESAGVLDLGNCSPGDKSGTIKATNAVFSGNTSTGGTDTLGGETMSHHAHFFCGGFSIVIAATNAFQRCYATDAVTIEAITYNTNSPPGAGCTTQPTIDVCYGSPATCSQQITMTNGSSIESSSGIITPFNVPANTVFAVRVETGPAGCSTNWQNVSSAATVREQ